MRLTKQRKMLLLLPYFFCQGVNMAYTYGNYPTFLKYAASQTATASSTIAVDSRAAINISTGFLLYGIGSMIGSYIWGKLYDLCRGRLYPLLGCHLALVLLSQSLLIGSMMLADQTAGALLAILITVGFIFGLTDFLTNAIINNSIAKNYETEPESLPSAFSLYRMCFCFGFALAAGASSLLPDVLTTAAATTNISGYDRYGWLIMIAFNNLMMLLSVSAGGSLEVLNNSALNGGACGAGRGSRRSATAGGKYDEEKASAVRKRKSVAALMLH
jgi:hypothetical protein